MALDIKNIASKLRQLWNIDTIVINNLTRIIEDHGVIVSTFDFGTKRVDSRSILTDDKLPIIFFKKNFQEIVSVLRLHMN